MTDIRITSDGDLELSTGGLETVDGADGIEQDVLIRLKSIEGDWFLNLRDGLPYFTRILVESPNESDLYFFFRDALADIPGVLSVDQGMTIERDSDGSARVSVTLQTIYGPLA